MSPEASNKEKKNHNRFTWVEGIERRSGKLTICFINNHNKIIHGSISELTETETPSEITTRKITANFQHWIESSTKEYTEALNLPSTSEQHLVWKFSIGQYNFIVPALALIKSLFRPHSVILEQLFRPQGLDGVCIPTHDGLTFTKSWSSLSRQKKSTSILKPIEWMWSYPSAKWMTSSLYNFACCGKLGLTLPMAKMRAKFYGKMQDKTLYVTKISVATIEPEEEPFPFAKHPMRTITFTGSYKEYQNRTMLHNENSLLPTKKNGDWRVSDEEWDILKNLIDVDRKNYKYSRRSMLNGLLQKFCTGQPWRKCDYEVGTFVTASKQYISWQHNGFWAKIEEVIKMRSKEANSTQPKKRNTFPAYTKLTDMEWAIIHKMLLEEGVIPSNKKDNRRKYLHRNIIDAILTRAVNSAHWRKDMYLTEKFSYSISTMYCKMKKNGSIEKLFSTFIKLRPGTEITWNAR